MKLEKIALLTNRCPSLDSRSSIRFQRVDPYHLKSTMFPINKFQSTSIVYLRCSIGICSGQTDNCQEVKFIDFLFEEVLRVFLQRICPDIRRPISNHRRMNFSATDENEEDMSSFVMRRRIDDEQQRKFARLLTDLSRSLDPFKDHYEVRQIQQQFSIESPLPQPTNKHQSPYGEKQTLPFSSLESLFHF